MSSANKLGRLERIDDLREVWPKEAKDFTPWLAKEGMEILSERLGMNLEVEEQEINVGRFQADILCKDLDDNSWVLIENQLDDADHKHLGQLLTYGAGLKAVTMIWIAKKFEDEHRATLDWLNENTDEGLRFFGLELELLRIGDSAPAPEFNIVSMPNEWSREVTKAKKRTEQSPIKQIQLAFWEQLYQNHQNHEFLRLQKPRPQHFMVCSIGRSGARLEATVNTRDKRAGVELFLWGDNATAFFKLLEDDKENIQDEIGSELIWRELPKKSSSRIITFLERVDPLNKEQWPQIHEWILEWLEKYHRVFEPRVKALNPDDYDPEDDDPDEDE